MRRRTDRRSAPFAPKAPPPKASPLYTAITPSIEDQGLVENYNMTERGTISIQCPRRSRSRTCCGRACHARSVVTDATLRRRQFVDRILEPLKLRRLPPSCYRVRLIFGSGGLVSPSVRVGYGNLRKSLPAAVADLADWFAFSRQSQQPRNGSSSAVETGFADAHGGKTVRRFPAIDRSVGTQPRLASSLRCGASRDGPTPSFAWRNARIALPQVSGSPSRQASVCLQIDRHARVHGTADLLGPLRAKLFAMSRCRQDNRT